MNKILLSTSLILLLAICQSESVGQVQKKSYYLIGNSLTWDTVPSRLDGNVQWHVDCGKSLPWMYANPNKPCVKNSTIWTAALKNKQYDYVAFQPHYGSSIDSDLQTISKWIDMQPKAIFVIHTGWARSKSRAEEYADKGTIDKMTHSPHYIRALMTQLKKKYPKRQFRQTHAIDLLNRVAVDVSMGSSPFEKVEDLYRDPIHMKTDTGRYLMHNAMRIALDQPRSDAAFKSTKPKIISYLNKVLDSHTKANSGAK